MTFWWHGTSYTKLTERGSPLSSSVWSSPSWLSGYHHGEAGGLTNGGPSIIGMWPPTGGLVPGAGPTGREGPSLAWWDSPPYGVLASDQGEEDLGDGAGGGPCPCRRRSRGWSRRSFLIEMLWWFCQSGSEPVLPSISDRSLSHSLWVSYHCSLSVSQMESHGEVCMAGLSNKTGACCCAGHGPLCSMPLEMTQLL